MCYRKCRLKDTMVSKEMMQERDIRDAPRVAFDIGGTFTDIVVVTADRRLRTYKVLSIPEEVAHEVRRPIEAVLNETGHKRLANLVHGTTIASNAVLEGKGAVTGLITTRGFRDEIEMRRLARPAVYDFLWEQSTSYTTSASPGGHGANHCPRRNFYSA